jgi:hypothetical protein
MHMPHKARLLLMSITVLSIAVLSVFGAGWAIPAGAQGTVPGQGGGGSNGGGSSYGGSNNPSGPAVAACGTGTQSFTVTGADRVTQIFDFGYGSAAFLSNQGGITQGVIRPLFSPITSLTASLVPASALSPSPAGWTNLGCGITLSGTVADGEAVTYVIRGQLVCFQLPVGATAAYNFLRIAYYDVRLGRWVFLQTNVGVTIACHASFRLAPTTFALFGGA